MRETDGCPRSLGYLFNGLFVAVRLASGGRVSLTHSEELVVAVGRDQRVRELGLGQREEEKWEREGEEKKELYATANVGTFSFQNHKPGECTASKLRSRCGCPSWKREPDSKNMNGICNRLQPYLIIEGHPRIALKARAEPFDARLDTAHAVNALRAKKRQAVGQNGVDTHQDCQFQCSKTAKSIEPTSASMPWF